MLKLHPGVKLLEQKVLGELRRSPDVHVDSNFDVSFARSYIGNRLRRRTQAGSSRTRQQCIASLPSLEPIESEQISPETRQSN
ncbi:unnamed protein product [Calypogeia fissa]